MSGPVTISEVLDRVVVRPEWYSTQIPPPFGHKMLSMFSFDESYINLNHGSYGSLPKPVGEACKLISAEAEANPDLFHRFDYLKPMTRSREMLAEFLGVKDVDEVVLVPNTSHGINNILRALNYEKGDVLVPCDTTYNSVSRTTQYLHDRPPHPTVASMLVPYPPTPQAILDTFRKHLDKVKKTVPNGKKIIVIVDAISSTPAIVFPWREMVKICAAASSSKKRVFSVIDAAHSIGQEPDIKLDEIKPDFWVSNCHKWLFAKRSCAVMYVPKRNQHLVPASFPTSYMYGTGSWVNQYEWNGTIDFTPFLSVPSAIHFREWVGGEKAIHEYCSKLAVEGGKRLAEMLGTYVLDAEYFNMVNVALPFKSGDMRQLQYDLLKAKAFASPYEYGPDGTWWVRCSAQIWNEIGDFEEVGKVLLKLKNEKSKL